MHFDKNREGAVPGVTSSRKHCCELHGTPTGLRPSIESRLEPSRAGAVEVIEQNCRQISTACLLDVKLNDVDISIDGILAPLTLGTCKEPLVCFAQRFAVIVSIVFPLLVVSFILAHDLGSWSGCEVGASDTLSRESML